MIILHPPSTFIAGDVDPARIAPDAVIHPGCRLYGSNLSIGPGSEIGAEAPATVRDCQLGANVHLAGGFFERATFLDGFKAGSAAHVRPGCLFEEGSSIAHGVGAKQTMFMPWVTAGSLINFCDALMAGGTSRKNHSEIGSSYVHFNFTPRRDKATASLVGDVPRGVLLNNPAIFLGGQGGIVGPCAVDYGTLIPAGKILRREKTNAETADAQFVLCDGKMRRNLAYIGNLLALDTWYRVVRSRFMSEDFFQRACHEGALLRIAEMLDERLTRLDEFARNVASTSAETGPAFAAQWKSAKENLTQKIADRATAPVPREVMAIVEKLPQQNYLQTIQSLATADAQTLTFWLQCCFV